MDDLTTFTYDVNGRIARITLNRPERGNGITLEMPRELSACVERANLDPEVHVIALAGNGSGFCGGYDLVASAEGKMEGSPARMRKLPGREAEEAAPGAGSPIDPMVQARNHDPEGTWDPVTDFQMMSRNVRGFMSLFHSEKPVVCKVHGYCVAGGTDMALCSDLIVAEDTAKIGYPPARVWGVPTTALWAYRIGPARAKRLLLTGDSIDGDHRGRVGARRRGPSRRGAGRRLRGAAGADRAAADQPVRHAQAAGQPGRSTRRACRPPRRWGPSSTASLVTRRRASHSSSAPPRRGSRKRCASGTSRSVDFSRTPLSGRL